MRRNKFLRIFVSLFLYGYTYNTTEAIIVDDFTTTTTGNSILINGSFLGAPLYRTITDPSITVTSQNLEYSGSTNQVLSYDLSFGVDLNNYNLLKITFNNLPTNFDMALELESGSSNTRLFNPVSFTTGTSIYNIDLTGGSDSGTFNFSSVTRIAFLTNQSATAVLQYDVASIEVVPEPLSMLSLSAGLALLVKNRRRKLVKK